ncbi:Polcalcin Jun o 2 [Orchesella cincta]|uniref:Polcalcin Jun o 2 n=1 Tax=Orchesella cincta TaxID=48709 RepID=A0A1D2NKW6_ORCCI|nr:Polcalcin Jun o 2 [Orchesella cincta]
MRHQLKSRLEPEDETPAEDGEAEEEGRSIFGSIKKRAEQLMDSINEAHAGDPKDVLELAKRTLEKAFNNFNGGKDEISVAQLLSVIELAGGEERLHTLRILELMDKDMDGEISREEFVQLYAAPMAFPDKALELMHRSFDLDDNGLISQWERLRYLLTLEGINQNIYDKYAQALQLGYAQDSNSDGLTSLTEFMLYMVWQINLGMEQVKSKGVKRPFPLPADGGVFNEPLPIDEASGVFPEPLPVEESQPVPEGDPPPTE